MSKYALEVVSRLAAMELHAANVRVAALEAEVGELNDQWAAGQAQYEGLKLRNAELQSYLEGMEAEVVVLAAKLARWEKDLLPSIAHGDVEHRLWLQAAIQRFAESLEAP